MVDIEQNIDQLDTIKKEGKLYEKVGEVVAILNQLLDGSYTLGDARRIDAILSNYKGYLLNILKDYESMAMKKAVAETLLKLSPEEDVFLKLVELVELGQEEVNFSWDIARRLMRTPGTYPYVREAILTLLQSREEYHKMLGLAIIREYKQVHRRKGKGKRYESIMTTVSAKKTSVITREEFDQPVNDVALEQIAKDWLIIVRNIIRETKSEKIREQAWTAIATISNIEDEKKLYEKEVLYSVLYNILLEFQPNIQVQLTRIADLAKQEFSSDYVTVQNCEVVIKEIVNDGNLSGKYFELEQVFVRENGKELYSLTASSISKKYLCYYCGIDIDKDAKVCENCGKEILKCNVCRLPISFAEEFSQCKHCKTKAHISHLKEWVKVKGKCPTCQKNLTADDIQPIYEVANK